MDLTAPRRDLLSAIETALPASDHGSAMPVLHSLRVTARANGSVSIVGSDMLVSCTARTQAKAKTPGSACIPGKLLRDVVNRMKEGDITLSLKGSSLSIKGAGTRSATSIPTMPGEDYPSVPTPEGDLITVPAATLAALFKITKATASPDDTRPHLAAVMVMLADGKITAVSTDGHRMSIVSRPLKSSVGGPWLIPYVFLARAKMPEEGDIILSAKHEQGPLAFQWGPDHRRVTWTTKLVDAAYPSYEQAIPSRWDMTAACSREELLESFRAVSLVASDRTSGVKMTVKTADGRETILLHSENPDRGEMDDDLPCEIGPGNDPASESKREMFIGLDADYVTQALSTLPGERVTLCMTGELDPLRLECADEPGYVGVIMPMRV